MPATAAAEASAALIKLGGVLGAIIVLMGVAIVLGWRQWMAERAAWEVARAALAAKVDAIWELRLADVKAYGVFATDTTERIATALNGVQAGLNANADSSERIENALRTGTPPPYRRTTPGR